MPNIIEIRNLKKMFKDFTAVDNLTLDIKEGEIFGFLGPNGAGKTTTISMLTTLIRPTEGNAKVGGYDLIKEGYNVRSIIGVVPQTFSLFPELTAKENLTYIGRLYGLSRSFINSRTKELLEIVSLYDHRDRIAGNFSGGMKQRLSLCASIMSKPKILFMDEPTTGLDPQSRIAMRELTKKLNKEGMTIVYTTHDMEEADKLCDRITIMDKGSIIADGKSEDIKMRGNGHLRLRIVLKSPTKTIVDEIKELPYINKLQIKSGTILVDIDNKDVFNKLSTFFYRKKQEVMEMCFQEPTLEDVFIKLTKKELRD